MTQTPYRRREVIEGYLFAAPFLIGFVIFILFPMLWSLLLVFQKFNLFKPFVFNYVGLTNVNTALNDPKMWYSLWNTAYFAFVSVPLQLALAFLCAVLLNRPLRGSYFYRTALYLPVIVPIVVSAFIWQRVYHPDFGILNEVLGWVGIAPQQWLFNPLLAKPALIFMRMWAMGTQMVIFLAGLQSVPAALLEAAAIDGANTWRKFWSITVPLMTPVIFFNLIVGIIGNFQVFAPALIMTEGGPEDATLFMVLYIYRNAFEYMDKISYAATLSWVLFLVVIVLTFIQFWGSGRWVYYETK